MLDFLKVVAVGVTIVYTVRFIDRKIAERSAAKVAPTHRGV